MISNNKRRGEEDHQDGLRRCSRGRVDDDDKRRRHSHKHLYVTLDDWSKGFSIYKIDTDILLDDDEEQDDELPLYHLEPPILRLESPAGQSYHGDASFSALGTKIFALMNHRCGLVYDTETGVVAVGPHAPEQMAISFGTYLVPVDDDTLYALWYHPVHRKFSLFAMSWGPTAPDAMGCPTVGWSWKQLPSPPATLERCVSGYALHPDGHHILFSTSYTDKNAKCTYSFDTKRSVWTWLGDWTLPFMGQGHFDAELDAWVGICFDGTVCACKSISPSTLAPRNGPPLSWKATKERLAEDLSISSRSFSVSLTPAGRSSKFCLVERLARDVEQNSPGSFIARACELRVTMFRLKYNHEGQLQTSSNKQRASFSIASPCRFQFEPGVFRM